MRRRRRIEEEEGLSIMEARGEERKEKGGKHKNLY